MLRDRAVRQLVGFMPRRSVVQIHLPLLINRGLPHGGPFVYPFTIRRVKPRPADLLLRKDDVAMIYKRCSHCGKRIPSGTTCQCRKREYSKPQGIYTLYHTQRWQNLRASVMARYNGVDQWALHEHNRIECAETVHHIIPTVDNEELFFSVDNLIPVSRGSHDEIHALYKTDKQRVQERLQEIVKGRVGGG